MQQLINTVQGDGDYDFNFTLTDSVGTIIDLTNGTLVFNAQLLSDLSVQFSGVMAIVNAMAGTCKYTVQSKDFPVAGTYNCQVVLTYSYGEKVTFADIQVCVEARVPIIS